MTNQRSHQIRKGPQTCVAKPLRVSSAYFASSGVPYLLRVTAGRGVEKVEPGSEKILGVGLDFKVGICPAHPRPDVGLEKLRALCEAYAKRGHKKFTSGHQSLVCAYAKHM